MNYNHFIYLGDTALRADKVIGPNEVEIAQ